MQKASLEVRNPFVLLQLSFNTLTSHPVLLFPFSILAFVQFFVLELLYFVPRYPLVLFFGPILKKMGGETFLHYPNNYALLSKWFHGLQIPIYIFLTSFILGTVIGLVYLLDSKKEVTLQKAFQRARSSYIHLVAIAFIVVFVLKVVAVGYNWILERALVISSTTGIASVVKQVVLVSSPVGNLLLTCLVTALFAFVLPIIVIEKKNVLNALKLNFLRIGASFWTLLGIAFLSGLLYLPILFLQHPRLLELISLNPEARGSVLIIGVLLMIVIDALLYTAVTIYYLSKKRTAS